MEDTLTIGYDRSEQNDAEGNLVRYGNDMFFTVEALDKEFAKVGMKSHTCPICREIFAVPIDSEPIRYDEEVGGTISRICNKCEDKYIRKRRKQP